MESPNKPVSELTYYELLGVSKDATPNEIKKGYYKMARFYHPDKNPDDKEAEENFKRVGTAHTVLMDEEKRAIYDKFGEEGVKQSEDGGEFDMAEMLKLLFGAGEFDECFGEISFATAMDPKFYSKSEEEQVAWLEEHQKQREEKLVESLKEKISLYIKDDSKSGRAAFDKFVMDDIHTKEEVPGGPALLSRLGYVYRQEAKQHLSRFLGIESVFAGIAEKGHIVKEAVKIAMSAVEMQQMEENFDPESMTEEEKMEYERQVGEKGMNTMWKLGLLEIESVVRSVCETVMRDTTISKGELKKRKKAILRLGELYRNEGRRLVKEDQNDFDAYQHIEEQLHPNHQDHTEENISEPEKVETSTTNTDTQTPKQEETTTVPDEPLEKKEKNKKESKPPEPANIFSKKQYKEPEPDSCSSSEEVPATGGYDDMD